VTDVSAKLRVDARLQRQCEAHEYSKK
ncbi:uncharacterized protein METZ01_LOCUS309867, partial [marine metagenome]